MYYLFLSCTKVRGNSCCFMCSIYISPVHVLYSKGRIHSILRAFFVPKILIIYYRVVMIIY